MTMTLIGSRAMKMHYPDSREPKGDWDYHTGDPKYTGDIDPREPGNRYDIFVDARLSSWPWGSIATPDELYTMKISHGYWDINGTWDKHARDIAFLQRHGCVFIPELHDLLKPIWAERYRKNKISLNKTAKEFFTDHVQKVYVHDTVHDSVAYRDRPWFYEFLKDGSEVLTDNDKFWALPLESRLQAIREELYVIALERKLILDGYTSSPMGAYQWALRRTATSLFKNRWALELLLHLDELARPDVDYVQRHKDNAHKLIPMEG
jgi:hypothetical protein